MATERSKWAFWAVIVAGVAYIVAFCLSFIPGIGAAMHFITACCALIAWVLVMLFGWSRVPNQTIWKVVYLICCVAIIALALIPSLGSLLSWW